MQKYDLKFFWQKKYLTICSFKIKAYLCTAFRKKVLLKGVLERWQSGRLRREDYGAYRRQNGDERRIGTAYDKRNKYVEGGGSMTKEKEVKEPLFHITKRKSMNWWQSLLTKGASIFAAVIVVGILSIVLIGQNPFRIFGTFFKGLFIDKLK